MIQKLDKYVNDIKFNGSSINRIYLNGDVYWGNDPAAAPTPSPLPSRYQLCDYIQNNTDTGRGQNTKATFSLPWAPDASMTHRIDVNMTPISVPTQLFGWSVFFGGNVKSLSHLANIFGGSYYKNNKTCFFSSFGEPTAIFNTVSGIDNYLNKLWHLTTSTEVGTSNAVEYSIKLDIDNVNILNTSNTTTSRISGTYDPYFIFGGQIQHSSNNFAQVQFKLHSFDIYDNDVIVYQLIPAYDTIDNLYGMYDLVNDIFYSSINAAYPFTGHISS